MTEPRIWRPRYCDIELTSDDRQVEVRENIITDAMIERAARAMRSEWDTFSRSTRQWADLRPSDRRWYLDQAEAALRAAFEEPK
jgi:hypothetical protein